MRQAVLILAFLAAVAPAGCSRQPTDHVGEWESNAFSILKGLNPTYSFSEDGKVLEKLPGNSPAREGTYKVDYSKKPVQIDIQWLDGGVQSGILRFVGAGKTGMEVCLVFGDNRPADFGGPGSMFLKKRGAR